MKERKVYVKCLSFRDYSFMKERKVLCKIVKLQRLLFQILLKSHCLKPISQIFIQQTLQWLFRKCVKLNVSHVRNQARQFFLTVFYLFFPWTKTRFPLLCIRYKNVYILPEKCKTINVIDNVIDAVQVGKAAEISGHMYFRKITALFLEVLTKTITISQSQLRMCKISKVDKHV